MSIAELNSLYSSAAAAMASADWDGAITYLMQMQARLASTPNIMRQLAGGGSQQIQWNASQIAALIADCRRQSTAAAVAAETAGPWQSIKVTYKRAT